MGDIFGVAKISIIFGGCLKFLIFFAGREPTYEEKMRVPPPPGLMILPYILIHQD